MAKSSERYGLILPDNKQNEQKVKPQFKKPSIFENDSDSNDGFAKRNISMSLGSSARRQAQKMQEKALEEDPTVFQYDELYDEMENQRDKEKKAKKTENNKPRYIKRLLEAADRRKLENERRMERNVQKEREQEGEEFKDKESFVTEAYRHKLEEFKEAEEREKIEDYLEKIGDVRKQQDLGGFYRHLYEQKVGTETCSNENSESISKIDTNEKIKPKTKNKRIYRKRKCSEEKSEEESINKDENISRKQHLQSNLDADSDFSIDSSSSSDNEDSHENNIQKSEKIIKTTEIKEEITNTPKIETLDRESDIHSKPKIDDVKVISEEIRPKEIKIDIWKKRTIGEIFDAALKRYYKRKSQRNA